ncbi:hypothetical protein [Microbacterium yannicii]|uniref:hypothetical protein n=1 Tax=Microbacterium yannicii TaxID=671622 RepID=UPI0012F81D31|nr:hypothetical protein [Microbacterium yannicii]
MDNQETLDLFAAIDENVRTGSAALRHTLLYAKAQAARSPLGRLEGGRSGSAEVAMTTSSRVAHLLLAAQYEARLAWLTWHPHSRLTTQQREDALRGGLSARWQLLLKIALADRLARREPSVQLGVKDIPRRLPPSDRARYFDLLRVARDHLNPLIDTRNSLAHGEWTTALARSTDGINVARTADLDRISLFRVTILANLLEHFWKCYFDALVTYQAFERDFPIHHQRMMHAARRLETSDEQLWLRNLRRRFVDGRSSTGGLSDPPKPPELVIRDLRKHSWT